MDFVCFFMEECRRKWKNVEDKIEECRRIKNKKEDFGIKKNILYKHERKKSQKKTQK